MPLPPAEYSKQMIDKTVAEGTMIRFNLTNMDLYKSFMGIGEYKNSIIIQELIYIYRDWNRLSGGVRKRSGGNGTMDKVVLVSKEFAITLFVE